MLAHRVYFFFFQAEDGIRDGRVTGVQTCALPISAVSWSRAPSRLRRNRLGALDQRAAVTTQKHHAGGDRDDEQIGRASCRERVEISVGGGSLKKKKNQNSEAKPAALGQNGQDARR